MKKGNIGALFVAAILLGFSANSQAITITSWNHDGGSTPADYELNVNQGGGEFIFDLIVTGGNADLFGFFFNLNDTSSNYTPLMVGANIGAALFGTDNAVTICGFDTSNCGSGNNLNGLPINPWDVGIQIGNSGLGGNPNVAAFFSLPDLGFGLDDFESFGVRSQSTGSNQQGSDKAYAVVNGEPPVEVPEPASMMLMGLGLVGLGLTRRKKKLS